MLLVAPLFMASSCEKPCDENDPKSDCYVQPPEPPEPPVPPVEQRDTVFYFWQSIGLEPIKDTANLRAVAALPEIRTVYLSPKDGYVWGYDGELWNAIIEKFFVPAMRTSIKTKGKGNIQTEYPGIMLPNDSLWCVAQGFTVNSPGKDWKANNFSKKHISKGYQKGKGYRGR
jgi:hypothetical protein